MCRLVSFLSVCSDYVCLCVQVQLKNDATRSFALKVLKKRHILDTSQQGHILSERRIMMEAHSPFLIRSDGGLMTQRKPVFTQLHTAEDLNAVMISSGM